MLPVLAAEEGGYAARWRPVLAATDAQRARELAAAMPPLLRAGEDTPPGPLLAGMLDTLADAEARTRLPGPLVPARRGRRPARIPYPERMVASAAEAATAAVIEEERLEDTVRDLEERLTKARADLSGARMRARRAEAAERKARQNLGRLL